MTIRLAFVDLDGTLLNSALQVSPHSAAILEDARQNGLEIVLASGRPVQSIVRFASSIKSDCRIIASNGGCVISLPDHLLLHSITMPPDVVAKLRTIGEAERIALCLYTPSSWFTSFADKYVALEEQRSGTRSSGSLAEISGPQNIIKAMFVGEHSRLVPLAARLSIEFDNQADAFFTYPEYLEVMPTGVSKANACEFILNYLGITWHDCLVIGDGANDVSMMQKARYRVAMSNADDRVKDISNIITLSNDDDGAAIALQALALGDEAARRRLIFKVPQ
jgi:Cof subfamily protein (haloacid dehalogenase superfamily)